MAKVKIKLQDTTPPRMISIETGATIGADIGLDLRYNGEVQSLAQLRALFGASGGSGVSAHRLLQGLTIGDDHPQYTRRDILTTSGDLYVRSGTVVSRLGVGAAGTIIRVSGGMPAYQAPAALTKTDDTNVTLTLGGSPTTSLITAASLTLGWTGTLAATRGGTSFGSYAVGDMIYATGASALGKLTIGSAGNILKTTAGIPSWTAPAALTKTDDTNVTITLGGSAATSLVNAASITLGWTGTLGTTRGGTNIGSYATGDILYASATNVLSKLAAGTNTHVLTLAGGVPTWAAPSGGGTVANPTATIGLTAVNGVATSAIRSDGAPALSQAIAPTWTGTHIFTGAADTGSTPSSVSIGNLNTGPNQYPAIRLVASAAPTNAKVWRHYVDEGVGTYVLQTINDANSGASVKNAIVLTRTATAITNMNFGNSVDNPAMLFSGRAIFDTAYATTTHPLELQSANPYAAFRNTSVAANNKLWIMGAAGDAAFRIYAVNDADSVYSDALAINRSGTTLTNIVYGNTTDIPVHLFRGQLAATLAYPYGSTFQGGLIAASTLPMMEWFNTASAANTGRFQMYTGSGIFVLRTISDNGVTSWDGLRFTRNSSSGWTTMEYGNSTNLPTHTIWGYLGVNTTFSTGVVSARFQAPGANAGIELVHTAGVDTIQAYSRTGSTYDSLIISGADVRVAMSGVESFRFTAAVTRGAAGGSTVLGSYLTPSGNFPNFDYYIPINVPGVGVRYIPLCF